jgi:hypothetical protein
MLFTEGKLADAGGPVKREKRRDAFRSGFGTILALPPAAVSPIRFGSHTPMKYPSIIGSLLLATLATSSALTESDLTEAAITGKTLTFTIETGAAPFATIGSWNGTFGAAPGKSFTMAKVSGDTVNSTGTWSYNSNFSGMYEYTLKPFVAGQSDGILTIWVSEGGVGRYEIFISGLFGNSQTGGFTIGSGAEKKPEISVQQPAGSELADGKPASKRSFGSVKVGKAGKAKLFTIKNNGTAALTGIAVKKDGAAKGDFTISQPAKTTLAPGESTKFKATFSPSAKGVRKAALHIKSNDGDENPFDIGIAGEGVK